METKKILLVDDDIDIITMLEAILKKENYTVITANNKEDGLKLLRAEKPDLAILDVMMTTHYEGFEMGEAIRKDPEFKTTPILMSTSIDILTTTKRDVQAMAIEFRKNPGFKELHVLLIKDIYSGKAGIDYLTEAGRSVWIDVDGFVSKPVDAKKIVPEIKRILSQK